MTPKLKTDAKKRSVLWRCPKCGCDDVSTSYHESRPLYYQVVACHGIGHHYNESKDEHLHKYCRTCSYDWLAPCLPIKVVKPTARKRGKGSITNLSKVSNGLTMPTGRGKKK